MVTSEIQNLIVQVLNHQQPEYIGVFGSYSRNTMNQNSDLDLLVRFKDSLSLLQLIRIENELSDRVGIKIELVTEGSLSNDIISKSILNDIQVIYEA